MALRVVKLTQHEITQLTAKTKSLFDEAVRIQGFRVALLPGNRRHLVQMAQAVDVSVEKMRAYALLVVEQFDSDISIPDLGKACVL